MTITKTELQQDLQSWLSRAANAYCALHRAGQMASEFHPIDTIPHARTYFIGAMDKWLERTITKANEGNASPREISSSDISVDIRAWPNSSDALLNDCDDIADSVADAYPAEQLANELNTLVATIGDIAFKEAAHELGKALWILKIHDWQDDPVVVRSVKGRLIIPTPYYGSYAFDRSRAWGELMQFAQIFDEEQGQNALVSVIGDIQRAEGNLSIMDDRLPSRTRFHGEGVTLEVFKESLKWHLDPDLFESFIAFVAEYSSYPLKEIRLQDRKQAA